MQRPTGGPNRERQRPLTVAEQNRKSFRRIGKIGVGLGVLAFLGGGALAFDVIGHTPPNPTIGQEVFPQWTPSAEANVAQILIVSGGVGGLLSGGLVYASQEPSHY